MTAETSDHKPAGYCPKCGYRIDPGRCPECGADVPAHRLAKSPHAYKHHKEKVAVLVAAVLIGAFLYTFRDGLPGLLPTSLLYSLYADGKTSAACELWWRYEKGSLSASQKSRLLDLALEWPDQLYIDSPYPSGASLEAHSEVAFHVALGSAAPEGHVEEGTWEVRVDRHLVVVSPTQCRGTMVRTGCDSPSLLDWPIPPLSAGEHAISVDQRFHLISLEGKREKQMHTWDVSAAGLVTIKNPPIDRLYIPVIDEDIAQQVERAFQISADAKPKDPQTCTLAYRFEAPPVRIVSSIWARVREDDAFYPVVSYVSVPPGQSKRGIIRLCNLPGIDSATHVDVRLIPFPMGADVIPENRRYYGRTIERLGIPLPERSEADKERGP